MLIAAWAVEAEEVYIYLRDEYPHVREILLRGDRRARGRAGLTEPARDPPAARRRGLYLRRGDGDAGEHRRQARLAPAQAALPAAGRAVRPADADPQRRDAVLGARHRRDAAPNGSPATARNGRRACAASRSPAGSRSPGVKLAPAGITVRELIDEYCGGMARRPPVQGLSARRRLGRHPAGDHGRHPARFRHAASRTAASSARPPWSSSPTRTTCRAVALNLMRFFEDESCGQCTPCRVRHREGASR